MPENWKTYKLKELTTKIGSGATPRGGKSAYKKSGISLIRSQNVLNFNFSPNGLAFIDDKQAKALQNVKVEPNDVLLNITGDSVARVCQLPEKWVPARVNQHVAIIRSNPDFLNSDFLKYSLLSRENKNLLLTMAGAGATRNALTKTMIEEFEISIPGIQEQKEIASILSALDDKIELNLQMNKTLEEMAMAMYKHWLVDFGPFQNEKFISSELGEIPEGWEVKSLGDLVKTLSKGTTPRKKDVDRLPIEIPFLKVKDISDDGSIKFSGIEKIPELVHRNQLKRSILEVEDILISIAGTIGRASIVPDQLHNSNCNQALAFIRLKNKNIHLPIIYFWLKYPAIQQEIKSSIVQGVQANVSLTVLKNLRIALPVHTKLNDFLKEINPIFDKIVVNREENQTLTKLRDTSLPKIISGEVRVKQVEKILTQAL